MSKALISNNISGAAKDDLAQLYDSVILDIEKNKVLHAFQHKYLLTAEQACIAADLFEPIIIRQRAGVLLHASHPILNIINDYCDHLATAYVHHLKTKGFNCLSIGDSINQKIKADHNCLLVDDTREAFRVMGQTQTVDSLNIHGVILQDHAANGTPTYGLCTSGSQNCGFQATHMIGMHSMYNVNLDDLYLMFYRHNAYYMVNYMFIPYQLYNAALAILDSKLYNLHYITCGGEECYAFTMKDNSIPYIHRRDTWNTWAQWTTFRGPTFTLVKEVTQTIGPLQVQVITRVARNFVGEILCTIPLNNWVKRNVLVPDIVYFTEKLCCLKQKELPHILVPEHVVSGICSYSVRATDNSYQFTDVATLASGLVRDLTIGDRTYYERWVVPQETYNRAIISLFFIGALMRTQRTGTLSKTFSELKEASTRGMIGDFCFDVKAVFNRFVLWGQEHFKDRPDFQDREADTLGGWRLSDFKLVYLSDVIVNGNVTASITASSMLAPGDVDPTPKYGSKNMNGIGKGNYPRKKILDKFKAHITRSKFTISNAQTNVNQPIANQYVCNMCGNVVVIFGSNASATCRCGNVVNVSSSNSLTASRSSSSSSYTTRSSRSHTPASTHSARAATPRSNTPVSHTTTQSTSPAPRAQYTGRYARLSRSPSNVSIGTSSDLLEPNNPSVYRASPVPPVQPIVMKAKIANKKQASKSSSSSSSSSSDWETTSESSANTTTPQSTQPGNMYGPFRIGNYELCMRLGDIASAGIGDIYINASNGMLKLGTGVSASFAAKYPNLQKVMDRKKPPEVCDYVITTDDGAGKPVNIAHVNGPNMANIKSKGEFNRQIYATFANVFKLGTKYRTIVGCLISAGAFGGDKTTVIDAMLMAMAKCVNGGRYIIVTPFQADIDDILNRLNKTPLTSTPKATPTNSDEEKVKTDSSINAVKEVKRTEEHLERATKPKFDHGSESMTAIQRSFLASMFCDLQVVSDDCLMDIEPPESTGDQGYRRRQAWESTGTSDLGIANDIAHRQFPRTFKAGHCAMQAVYTAYYNKVGHDRKMAICDIIRAVHGRLINLGTKEKYASLYIFRGHWNQGVEGDPFVSAVAIKAMADLFGCNITINLANGKINKVCSDAEKPTEIEIYHKNNHFSAVVGGGAEDKFPGLVTEILTKVNPNQIKNKVWVELSAAPGMLATLVDTLEDLDGYARYACVYKPGLPLREDLVRIMSDRLTQKTKPGDVNRTTLVFYETHAQLKMALESIVQRHGGIGYLVSDAARAVNTEQILDSLHEHLHDIYPKCEALVFKTFANPISTWSAIKNRENVDTYHTGVGTEKYYIASGNIVDNDIEDMYERFHDEVTDHVAVDDAQDVYVYAKRFFTGEFKKFTPNIPKATSFTTAFKALTGYASASKTTRAVRLFNYPKTVFVAPTKTLCLKHQRMGVRSYTPHVVFSLSPGDVDTIIVDEISQFDVRYAHLLRIHFGKVKIVFIGDVYQTKGFAGEKIKPKTFDSIGVVNNLWEVYKIPEDIVDYLNQRYGFNMIFKGDVKKGLYFCSDKQQDITSIPIGGFGTDKIKPMQFIAMNTATVDELHKRKINANTVTTYTGSRDHTVTFVVDNRAMASQLVNHREVVYTALTRATNQLVVYGQERDMIKTIFKADNALLISLQEANNVRIVHENRIDIIENPSRNNMIERSIQPAVADDTIVTTPVKTQIATTVISKNIKCSAPLLEFDTIIPADMPEVQEGTLKFSADYAADVPKKKIVYKIDDKHILVKHQTSDGKLETLRTIISRYAKKNKKITPRNTKLLKSDLMDGLAKAIYGKGGKLSTLLARLRANAHSQEYKHNLQWHYEQYMKSLQQKVNKGSATQADYTGTFEPFSEFLKFFNKNQDKFDPKFKLDKAGQGVAAFSKKVNILFSCYARFILQEIRAELNGRDVYIATHDDEKDINSEVSRLMKIHLKKFRKFFNCDISEWDSRFLEAFCDLMRELLYACGCDKTYVDWFYNYRKKWKMTHAGKGVRATLHGKGKQFSGNPFTILENTICNLAFMWTILDIDDFGFALFKGDDSCIYAGKTDFSVKGKRILDMTGHITKAVTTDSGEFAGYMITSMGIFPDVLRYAAKFIGKNYRDEEHFLQAQDGLKERVRSVQNQTQLLHGCMAMEEHYPGMNAEDARVLFDYLKDAVNMPFSDLKRVDVINHIATRQ
jgi:O-acetyl-ADP-ribose deacetylase (regulator of RNase III)